MTRAAADGKINDAGMALRKAEEAGEYPSPSSVNGSSEFRAIHVCRLLLPCFALCCVVICGLMSDDLRLLSPCIVVGWCGAKLWQPLFIGSGAVRRCNCTVGGC